MEGEADAELAARHSAENQQVEAGGCDQRSEERALTSPRRNINFLPVDSASPRAQCVVVLESKSLVEIEQTRRHSHYLLALALLY